MGTHCLDLHQEISTQTLSLQVSLQSPFQESPLGLVWWRELWSAAGPDWVQAASPPRVSVGRAGAGMPAGRVATPRGALPSLAPASLWPPPHPLCWSRSGGHSAHHTPCPGSGPLRGQESLPQWVSSASSRSRPTELSLLEPQLMCVTLSDLIQSSSSARLIVSLVSFSLLRLLASCSTTRPIPPPRVSPRHTGSGCPVLQ